MPISLGTFFNQKIPGQRLLKDGQIWKIALGIAKGLSCVHSRDIVHRNLKPGNILLDEQLNAKITGFGLSKSPAEACTKEERERGDARHRAPETFYEGYTFPRFSMDIFSLGMIVWEMMVEGGILPYDGEGNYAVIGSWVLAVARSSNTIKDYERIEANWNWPQPIVALIRECWKDELQRPLINPLVEFILGNSL
jgi:serine/threonine protein kinase